MQEQQRRGVEIKTGFPRGSGHVRCPSLEHAREKRDQKIEELKQFLNEQYGSDLLHVEWIRWASNKK